MAQVSSTTPTTTGNPLEDDVQGMMVIGPTTTTTTMTLNNDGDGDTIRTPVEGYLEEVDAKEFMVEPIGRMLQHGDGGVRRGDDDGNGGGSIGDLNSIGRWLSISTLASSTTLESASVATNPEDSGAATTTTNNSNNTHASTNSAVVPLETTALSGRPPFVIGISCDYTNLSPYQILLRRQIEVFEAHQSDVNTIAQGRNKPIVLGQVGIRCLHCSSATVSTLHRLLNVMTLSSSSSSERGRRGAVYYPARVEGVYQAAQNMASTHLLDSVNGCRSIPDSIRTELIQLRDQKSSAGGGKKFWAAALSNLGVYEDECGLRFQRNWHAQGSEPSIKH